ncbi:MULTISPECIES: hypothetical protein [unclassified Psychrobacillus]|uniref:hypothetical protein n=1 Tax=unclassified Psychrobacillus TaxID=2636677 RepID=UPI002496B032|nr:hypothetical protein [Psychrobacillus sp. NEAU-3TGS]MDI2586778.1 hypothetical protein [Psychrobacillus sp. NEAU-3TGS]
MANISLAEAVKLKSILLKRIHELEEEIMRVAFITIEKGSSPEIGPRTVSVVDNEITLTRKDIRTLDKLIYEANISNTVTFKDKAYTIVEAIELATQMRAQARIYKQLGASEKERVQYGYGDGTTYVQVALFNPEEYRVNALQYEKEANKLSGIINAKNYSITINFDDEKYA